jgi:hypothetical protein
MDIPQNSYSELLEKTGKGDEKRLLELSPY